MRTFHKAMTALATGVALVAGTVLVVLVAMLAYSAVRGALVSLGQIVEPGAGWLGGAMVAAGRAMPDALWIPEASEFGLVTIGLLGAALALRAGAHQGIDVLTLLFPKRLEKATDVFVWAVTGGFGVALAWMGGRYVEATMATGGTLSSIGWPKWPFYLCYPLSGALMALWSLEGLLESLRRRPGAGPQLGEGVVRGGDLP